MDAQVAAAEESMRSTGCYIWKAFQESSRCAVLRKSAEALLGSDAAKSYPRSIRVWELYRHGEDFVRLMCDNRLLELVAALLGSHALVSDFSLNQVVADKMPDKWHIDYPYTYMAKTVSGSFLGLQCIMPLSPFTVATGATQFVPGSFRHYSHPPDDPSAEAVTFLAEPGDLLVMAASTWHRAGVNTTPDPRSAILWCFIESWVNPMAGPPEDGPWAATQRARRLLSMERPLDPTK
ncbi:phytanoyl-CoA dioxygenase family protein [Nonomuraea sp. NPDC046802]|uniref:phytanoyl-CoA dioxygenase family protein n=1 Tax=Nonomuraea sp. NPDC046802 TaxID=3154919 RepID=UPI0033DB4374